MKSYNKTTNIKQLLDIVIRLRDPVSGCPWDGAQSFQTMAPYTIEEAYEVADAIANNDINRLKEELGDLLFHIAFYAQIGSESNDFDFTDICMNTTAKMIRRHPHVFGADNIEDENLQTKKWEALKTAERIARAKAEGRMPSTLDDVPEALPSMSRALKLQKRMADVGFDWTKISDVKNKIQEELDELADAISQLRENTIESDKEPVVEEFGDLLFSMVNYARHIGIDAETALRQANSKIEVRFRKVEERIVANGCDPTRVSVMEYERLWEQVKRLERGN